MPLGYQGQTCSDAIKAYFKRSEEPLSYSRIFKEVKQQGAWKNTTIWRHLMRTVLNLIPARYEWRTTDKFLFLRPDGRYELYDPKMHPEPIAENQREQQPEYEHPKY